MEIRLLEGRVDDASDKVVHVFPGEQRAGDVITVADDEAERLIAAGSAESLVPAAPAKSSRRLRK